MYTVIRRYRSTEVIDEIVKVEDTVRQLITTVPGFVGYYLVRSEDGGASITVCETQEGTSESTRRAAEWMRENLPNLQNTTPEITEGDTVLSFER